jgi:exosortase
MASQNLSSSAEVNLQPAWRSAWQLSIAMVAVALVVLTALFWGTVTSAVDLWGQPTYNYAFLILPISAYLIWCKREEVRVETPVGSLWGSALTAAFAFFWVVSDAFDINEGRHIAFLGMVLGLLLASLGWRVFKILLIPFLYLWLLVPTGTVFLPLLQQIATSISSEVLRWLGIPVYAEGFFIEVPSGGYHIEPGCAGLNLILASLALAPLYAYLLFRSFWKRMAVVILAIGLAIVMNGVRIATIIALAHWGGQRLNIVDDHLLYGWGFFAIVLFGAGYLGSFFADDAPSAPTKKQGSLSYSKVVPNSWFTVVAVSLSLLVIVITFAAAKSVASNRVLQSSLKQALPSIETLLIPPPQPH